MSTRLRLGLACFAIVIVAAAIGLVRHVSRQREGRALLARAHAAMDVSLERGSPECAKAERDARRASELLGDSKEAHALAHVARACRDLDKGDLLLAEGELHSAERLGAGALVARWEGSVLLAKGRAVDAQVAFARALSKDPSDARARLGLGDALMDLGEEERAVTEYRRVLDEHPSVGVAHNRLGLALAATGEIEAAERAYRRAAVLEADAPEPWNNLGNLLRESSRSDEARRAYGEALRRAPTDGLVLFNLGILELSLGRPAEAERHLRRATEVDRDGDALAALAECEAAQGRLVESERTYAKALEIDPVNAASWSNLGVVYTRLRRPLEAERAFRKAIEISPGMPEAWNGLGTTLLAGGELEEARRALTEAVRRAPDRPQAHFNLSLCYERQGRMADARASRERACALGASMACERSGQSRQ